MALPPTQDLPAALRGDSFNVPFAFNDNNNAPVDLSGWTMIFTLKHHHMQPDEESVLQKRMVILGSSAVLVFRPEDTNELTPFVYEYDVQLTTPDGTGVRTFLMGKLEIKTGVTHALI